MTSFQMKCLRECEALLKRADISYEGPTEVHGKKETYFVLGFTVDGKSVELFIYDNEAGAMIDRRDWTIFESPDFDSQEALVEAFTSHVGRLVGSDR